ncbi:MAG: alpha/beta hydrolase-fold protein [Saprospiraceae bacterium]
MKLLSSVWVLLTMLPLGLLPAPGLSQRLPTITEPVDSVYSTILEEQRFFYVHLPASYETNASRRYPVVYLLDGEIQMANAVTVYENYYGGFLPEMILIGISNQQHRTRDLTPTAITTKYGMPFREESGGSERFTQFLEKELIATVESKYRTTSYRTLAGHSYGGLFTIQTLLHHPELFANYLAIDPSLDWDDQVTLNQARSILTNENFKGKYLFMSLSGQLHMQNPEVTIDNVREDTTDYTLFPRSNLSFADLAHSSRDNNLTFDWQFYPDELHGTVVLPALIDGLKSAFKWFQMENTSQFNDPATKLDIIKSIVQHRTDKLKAHFGYPVAPYPEEIFNMLGYMSQQMQDREKAKYYFSLAVQYYPFSTNAYDSLAEYYEGEGDFAQALELMEKACALSDDAQLRQHRDAIRQKMGKK